MPPKPSGLLAAGDLDEIAFKNWLSENVSPSNQTRT